MPNQAPLPSVLLLCESEALGALDKRALREAGVPETRVMTSGIEAARLLAGLGVSRAAFQPDIVVCTQKLSDMDGEQFCAILRLHPRLLALPVLLILPNDSEAEQLKTLGSGASALLGRPYSIPALRQQLLALAAESPRFHQLRKAAHHADTSAFDAALATYGILLRPERQPEDYFRVGMRCLEENRWNHAITAFQRALRGAQIKGEAELGMAAAWRGKGDMLRFRAWLARAADTFVRAHRWHRARTAYARLLQEEPAAKNPFLAQAHRLIRANAYDEAVQTLVESLDTLPENQAHDRFARLCLSARDPESMLAALQAGLERSLGDTGDALSKEIRESLDIFAQERLERQRQGASERQWQLNRAMAAQKAARAAEATSGQEQQSQGAGQPSAMHDAGGTAGVPEDSDASEPLPRAVDALSRDAGARVRTGTSGPSIPDDEETEADNWEADSADADAGGRDTALPDEPPLLEPLTEAEATSGLFSDHPKLNELLSVIKLTWKLMRRNR